MANEVYIPKNFGEGGSHVLTSKNKELLEAIADDINSLKVAVDNLITKFNAHLAATHPDSTNTISPTTVTTKIRKS